PRARGAQVGGRARAQQASELIGQAQLGPIVVGLLEMVGNHLLVLEQPIAGNAPQPIGEAGVEVGPLLVGEGWIGGIEDQAAGGGMRGGTLMASRSAEACQSPLACRSTPVSISMATSSSTNSGLPSAVSPTRCWTVRAIRSSWMRLPISSVESSAVSGSRSVVV